MSLRVSKSIWRTALGCGTQAWLDLRYRPAPDDAVRFRMMEGQEVGALARELFPGGRMVAAASYEAAVAATAELVADAEVKTLFEAAFLNNQLAARPDILMRLPGGGWHLLEVKTNLAGDKLAAKLIDDAAYTAMVLQGSGLRVKQVTLLLLSRAYRKGGAPQELFAPVDVTAEVLPRATAFAAMASHVTGELLAAASPAPALGPACRNCGHFDTQCLGVDVPHTVLELPGLHANKLMQLAAAGVLRLDDVPATFPLNPTQERVKQVAGSGIPFVAPSLAGALDAVSWPCYYLDFESVGTAVPLYDGLGCHAQVTTQFSLHCKTALEAPPSHQEFLSDAAREGERELATALIAALGDAGSVMVYSSYEKQRMQGMMAKFPELRAPLEAIAGRLVDLLAIVKAHVYHPLFRGSFSIKEVLPALAPDVSYEGLTIRNGQVASAEFARLARGGVDAAEVRTIRQALLAYCYVDTLAMVRLHEVLAASAGRARRAGG